MACVAGAIGIGYLSAMLWKHLHDLPDVTIVERYEPIEAIQLFDKNDRLICTVEGDEDRRVVPLTQISTQMQQAMLAAEDHHFYEHHGVNVPSIFRAMIANFQAHKVVEGGSTITQQLVKNLFFTDAQRTFDRKIKEAYMAYEVESHYPKERILQMYLNQVYFGNNAYGIERAASRYFDRSAATLDLAQSAFLAGLVKAPSELGTPARRKEALDRQQEILDKMFEYGYITEAQQKKAKVEKLSFRAGSNPLQKYPYYVSYVLEILHDHFSQSEMRRQGLRVYTNLDPQAQEAAEKTLNDAILGGHTPKGVSQAALVSVSVADGSVVALVGGVGNYWTHQFNRATNPHTAGSSFKPFVYLTALLKGTMTPDSIVDDKPLVVHQPWGLPDYAPKNFDHRFLGPLPMRTALALSRNVCSVRIMQQVGVDNVIETAREAGITTKLEPNLSLALGSSAVTPFDMAGAYATFSRMGVTIKPQVLRRIENSRGQVVEVFEAKVDRAFQVEPVARLVDMMQGVVQHGTGTAAKLPDRQVAGKTGTADAGKDIWFVGFTPDLCTATWGGNDENLAIPGQHVTGGDVMAKLWKNYMIAYYATHPTPPGEFVKPSAQTAAELAQLKKRSSLSSGEKVAKEATPAVGMKVYAPMGALPASDTVSTGPGGGSVVSAPASGTEEKPVAASSEPVTAVPIPLAPERPRYDTPNPTPAQAPPMAAPMSVPASSSTPLPPKSALPDGKPQAYAPGPDNSSASRLYPTSQPSQFRPAISTSTSNLSTR
jgi:1A family penicillin-binding protein